MEAINRSSIKTTTGGESGIAENLRATEIFLRAAKRAAGLRLIFFLFDFFNITASLPVYIIHEVEFVTKRTKQQDFSRIYNMYVEGDTENTTATINAKVTSKLCDLRLTRLFRGHDVGNASLSFVNVIR